MRATSRLLLFFFLTFSVVLAASLRGVVLDPAGRPIPGSQVTVFARNGQQPITTVADRDGIYTIDPLPGGQYLVQAEAPGMTRRVASAITIGEPDAATLDLKLDVA